MDEKEIQENFEGMDSTWWFREAVRYLLSHIKELETPSIWVQESKKVCELEVGDGSCRRN